MRGSLRIYVILTIFVLLAVYEINGRGGRGGGRGGSRGSSRYSSRSRSSGSTRSNVRYYRGPKYSKGSWKTAAAVGTVFGLMSYKTRRMYYSHPDREPRICYNEKNLRNGTFGYFICPEEYQKDDYAYCCGGEDEQRCCTYTDKSAEGRIAGIVVGVVVVCVIIGVAVYCFCVRRRRQQQQSKGGVIISQTKTTGVSHVPEQQPLTSPGFTSGAGGQHMPMQTYNTQQGMVPPQAYDSSTSGLPYSTNPGVPGMTPYPPPGGPEQYFTPVGQEPYIPPGGPEQYPPPTGMTGAPPAPGFAAQPPYPTAPAPLGFTDDKPPLPTGDVSEAQSYPSGSAQGHCPGAYLPPTGISPSAPPPSYASTQ